MDKSETLILSESYRVAMDSLCDWLRSVPEPTYNYMVKSMPSQLLVLLYDYVHTDMERYLKEHREQSLHEVLHWCEKQLT